MVKPPDASFFCWYGCGFFFIECVFLSLGEPVSFYLVAAAWCTVGLASLVAFTPGGLGIADAPGLYLYSLYGISDSVIGASFVLSRIFAMTIPLIQFLLFRLIVVSMKNEVAD